MLLGLLLFTLLVLQLVVDRLFYQPNLDFDASHACVKLLISAGVDINAEGRAGKTPLHYLLWLVSLAFGYEIKDSSVSNLVEKLIQNGADPKLASRSEETPLHVACGIGYHQTVMTLLKHGASVHSLKKSWITPLYKCCSQGKLL